MGQYPRIVPWATWEEWIFVKNGLYSTSSDAQRRAIEIVNMWKIRGRIPLSVESTIILNDCDPPTGYIASYQRSESELRMMYSIGVVRAVNSLVDPSQQGYYADSIYVIAAKIGLPGWFVELRHDATHNQFPSISLLRSAARGLLAWYLENYWNAQLASLESLHRRCIEESTSINRDKSFTFESAVFLPMFIDALLQSSPPEIPSTVTSSTAATMRAKACATLVAFWSPKIDDVKVSAAVSICRLLSAVIDIAVSSPDNVSDWHKYVLAHWIDVFFKRTPSEDRPLAVKKINRYLQSIADICEAMEPSQKEWMKDVDELLIVHGTPSLFGSSEPLNQALRKRKICPNECIVEKERFRQIGLTRRNFSCDDLYQVDEVPPM